MKCTVCGHGPLAIESRERTDDQYVAEVRTCGSCGKRHNLTVYRPVIRGHNEEDASHGVSAR